MAIDLLDKTSNANNLTNNGTSESSDTPFSGGNATSVDLESTESDYLSAPDSASLSITGNLTLECWVKFESTPGSGTDMAFINKWRDDGNQRSYRFGLRNTAGTLSLYLGISNDGTADSEALATWTPSTGVWYHVAIRYNTTGAANAQFYVDGATQGPDNDVADLAPFNSTSLLVIGAQEEPTFVSFFDGLIDEVRIWNVARTATEIANNRSLRLFGNETGLVAYYPFEALAGGLDLTSKYW